MNLLQITLALSVTLIVTGVALVLLSIWLTVRGRELEPDRPPIPSSDELDYVIIHKENHVLEVAQRVLKGLTALVSAAIASYGVAITDGTVTAEEWITLAVAAVGAGLVTWAVPNRAPDA